MMTTAPCPACTANVPQVDGNLILHRHRDRLGPCPAGQVPDPGVDEGEALAGLHTAGAAYCDCSRGVDHESDDREADEAWDVYGPMGLAELYSKRQAARIIELERARDAAVRMAQEAYSDRAEFKAERDQAVAQLAVVGPVLDAARALVNKGRLPSDAETYRLWATLDDAITAHDRELAEGT